MFFLNRFMYFIYEMVIYCYNDNIFKEPQKHPLCAE